MKIRYIVLFLFAAAFFIAAAYIDLALRGRSAYLKGEKYMALAMGPSLKKPAGTPPPAAGNHAEGLLLAKREFIEGESAAKYAYIWYRTAAESFSQPETRWTRMARSKAQDALALWNAELKRKGQ